MNPIIWARLLPVRRSPVRLCQPGPPARAADADGSSARRRRRSAPRAARRRRRRISPKCIMAAKCRGSSSSVRRMSSRHSSVAPEQVVERRALVPCLGEIGRPAQEQGEAGFGDVVAPRGDVAGREVQDPGGRGVRVVHPHAPDLVFGLSASSLVAAHRSCRNSCVEERQVPRRPAGAAAFDQAEDLALALHGAILMEIARGRCERSEEHAVIKQAACHQVHDLAVALDHAVHRRAGARRAARAAGVSTRCRQTTTLTLPVSSSSVTNITPLAVSGRWRQVTRPAVRAALPCGSVCSFLGSQDTPALVNGRASSASGWRPSVRPRLA